MMHNSNNNTGSLSVSEPVFLLVGHLQRAHGIKGEIAMRILTDFPERLRRGKTVFLGEAHMPIKILQVRRKQDLMLILFEGYSVREQVAELTNLDVFASSKGLPTLAEGEYYHHQLIGLEVYEGDELLGSIAEVLVTGANDVYVVTAENRKELLLPAIESVILAVDLDRKRMDVAIPDGLMD